MKLGTIPRTGEGALYHPTVTLYTVLLAFKRPPTVVLDADAVVERVAASVLVTVSLGVRERLSDDVRDFVNDAVTERVSERVHVLLRDADVVRVRVIVRVFREMETVWEVDTEPVWVAFTEVVIDRPRDRDADMVWEIVMVSVGVADAVIDDVSVWVDDLVVVWLSDIVTVRVSVAVSDADRVCVREKVTDNERFAVTVLVNAKDAVPDALTVIDAFGVFDAVAERVAASDRV
jgi:hypothetical protein